MSDNPTIHLFLMECHKVSTRAQFIIDSLPNADRDAAERSLHLLDALRTILQQLKHQLDNAQELCDYLTMLMLPLTNFLDNPPPHPSEHVPRAYAPTRGRPRYILDLHRALLLHDLGGSWDDVSAAMGVTRMTMWRHLTSAGLSTARREFTMISDDDLDEHVARFSIAHPFSGSEIMMGLLESAGIHLPRRRIQESLRRVDAIGVMTRWGALMSRAVYKVRGANALWHHDGNEKLKPWGFYIHGCIDGHSRLLIYMECTSNKRSDTVRRIFLQAVAIFGWPSRIRGDYGSENNGVEDEMNDHWGALHRAYLRGRSTHNVRMERTWRDARKDCIEIFRQIFFYLERLGLLDMNDHIHRLCLFLTFQRRIQSSLDRAKDAWNHHKLRTEGNRTPVLLYELSREAAINRGYWTGDAGDPVETINNQYGVDPTAPLPPANEADPRCRREEADNT